MREGIALTACSKWGVAPLTCDREESLGGEAFDRCEEGAGAGLGELAACSIEDDKLGDRQPDSEERDAHRRRAEQLWRKRQPLARGKPEESACKHGEHHGEWREDGDVGAKVQRLPVRQLRRRLPPAKRKPTAA